MTKIQEYPEKTGINSGSYLIETFSGEYKQESSDNLFIHAAESVVGSSNVTTHRSLFRGKNLNDKRMSDVRTQIQNGSFSDLYLGDYWVKNGITWRIADFDYWYYPNDVRYGLGNRHHIVVIPDTEVALWRMNDSATNEGYYENSAMARTTLRSVGKQIETLFGGTSQFIYYKSIRDGENTYDNTASYILPNEKMLHGCSVKSSEPRTASNSNQLALFKFAPEFIPVKDVAYWLQDTSNEGFLAQGETDILEFNATDILGIRPIFTIA